MHRKPESQSRSGDISVSGGMGVGVGVGRLKNSAAAATGYLHVGVGVTRVWLGGLCFPAFDNRRVEARNVVWFRPWDWDLGPPEIGRRLISQGTRCLGTDG